ncbi:MAG TPA: tyrosine-type recombinase/integrase [Candidatus Binatia bacterium]
MRLVTEPEIQQRNSFALVKRPLCLRIEAKRTATPSKLRRKALTAAGIRRVRFHDCRHTFTSLLLQQGESLTYVRDQLGHSSIQMTADVYGHLIPGLNKQAVDKLDDPANLSNVDGQIDDLEAQKPDSNASVGSKSVADAQPSTRKPS